MVRASIIHLEFRGGEEDEDEEDEAQRSIDFTTTTLLFRVFVVVYTTPIFDWV